MILKETFLIFPEYHRNIALNMHTWQSSDAFDDKAKSSVAVDGNKDAYFYGGSCTLTGAEVRPWWTVDLGTTTQIAIVAITNRRNCEENLFILIL